MTKVLIFIGKTVLRMLEWIVIFLILFAFAIRASKVQTFIAQQATKILSEKLEHRISIGRVDFMFFNRLILDDVYIDDVNRDTLADIKKIEVSLNYLFLKGKKMGIGNVRLEDGFVHLKQDSVTKTFNFQYLIDFFASNKEKEDTRPFRINISKVDLKNVHFKLDNESYLPIPFGVDYNHLDVSKIYLSAQKISIKGSDIKADIRHISFEEQSGFKLAKLAASVQLSQKGLFLDKVSLITENTSAKVPKLHFNMDSLSKFSKFVDEVSFDAVMDYSQVSLKDVSYFATALQGMDEVIKLEAVVTDRVKDLKISNLKVDIREKTTLQGNFVLPDFRNLKEEEISEEITYAYIDLNEINNIKLPSKDEEKFLNLNELVSRFEYAQIDRVTASGTTDNLFINLRQLKTGIGDIQIDHKINLFRKNEHTMAFREIHKDELPISIDKFDLGKLLDQKQLGIIDGNIHLDGEFSTKTGIALENIQGHFNRFDYNNYSYSNISLKDVSYKQKTINGNIDINDPNIDLELDGKIDLNQEQSYLATLRINKAFLNRINLIQSDSVFFVKGIVKADINGKDLFSYTGNINLDSVQLINGNRSFYMQDADIDMVNSDGSNSIYVRSEILDADIEGSINYTTIATDLKNTLAIAFPAVIEPVTVKQRNRKQNDISYTFNLKNINPVLNVFIPDLYIEKGTKIFGKYLGETNDLDLTVQSPQIKFKKFKADTINLSNNFSSAGVDAVYSVKRFYLNDSISFDSLNFVTQGTTEQLNSVLNWDLNTPDASEFTWNTQLKSMDDILLNIEKSYFTINAHRWNIEKTTSIAYSPKSITISDFELTNNDQFLKVSGKLTEDPEDKLNVSVNNLDLEDFANLLSTDMNIKGKANGDFHIADVFNSVRFFGNTNIKNLILNNSEVGDINVKGKWDNEKKAISVNGDLIYRNNKTFNIYGNYYIDRKQDNLDFKLQFDQTNIAFLNAFMDPKVISNIKGLLDGELDVKGELSRPLISGMIDLKKGNVKVAMFGVNYGFNGKVKVSEGLIQIDYMPLIDEEGNKGFLNGGIVHENFKNFNFDVFVGLDDIKTPDGTHGSFLAMNTQYEEGQIYYGKAYVTGWVSVGGHMDNMNIEVNLKTNKNTTVVIPLYGAEEIDDELSYTIVKKDTINADSVKGLDFTGINLNLNFDVTPDATIKLVFDDQTGDEITANGQGQISIKLDANKDLSMDGTYTITKGAYNFVFNPIKKEFKVERGSQISWKGGSPTDADLDITAIYSVTTDVSVIAPELESKRSTTSTQNVDARIYMNGSLNAPRLRFELKAPKASESAKAAIERINSDNDELNKQFFMILLTGRFQGTGSASGYGGNAALEALSGQINNLLDAVSKDVRLNVDLKNNEVTGQNSQAIGFETNVLNDKLVIKGNFGVQNNTTGTKTSTIIGDLNLEYIIDEAGNLRVSIFNESNSYSVIQDKNLGLFTQGIGLIYSESFNKIKEMNIINFVADWFRKDKHFKFTKHRRQKTLPEYRKGNTIQEENRKSEEEVPEKPIATPNEEE